MEFSGTTHRLPPEPSVSVLPGNRKVPQSKSLISAWEPAVPPAARDHHRVLAGDEADAHVLGLDAGWRPWRCSPCSPSRRTSPRRRSGVGLEVDVALVELVVVDPGPVGLGQRQLVEASAGRGTRRRPWPAASCPSRDEGVHRRGELVVASSAPRRRAPRTGPCCSRPSRTRRSSGRRTTCRSPSRPSRRTRAVVCRLGLSLLSQPRSVASALRSVSRPCLDSRPAVALPLLYSMMSGASSELRTIGAVFWICSKPFSSNSTVTPGWRVLELLDRRVPGHAHRAVGALVVPEREGLRRPPILRRRRRRTRRARGRSGTRWRSRPPASWV